ncbi:MAG: hypothetical protein ACYCOO_05510 [Chitinophagaceae bacterium]
MKKKYWIKKAAGFSLLAILLLLLLSWVVMGLWNSLLPGLIHVPSINFMQALGLFLLARILFGGFRGGSCWGRGGRRHFWGERMLEKWEKMSPEEQERFKETWNWKNRCGGKIPGVEKE